MNVHRVFQLLLESLDLRLALKELSFELVYLAFEVRYAADLAPSYDMLALQPADPIFEKCYIQYTLLVLHLSLG